MSIDKFEWSFGKDKEKTRERLADNYKAGVKAKGFPCSI